MPSDYSFTPAPIFNQRRGPTPQKRTRTKPFSAARMAARKRAERKRQRKHRRSQGHK